jgi:ribonuclease P protein subunit POP4
MLVNILGLQLRVVKSSHIGYLGISGLVVDETKNTIVLLDERGKRLRVPKKACVFRISFPNGRVMEVEGVSLLW